jgi:hypothetical protein
LGVGYVSGRRIQNRAGESVGGRGGLRCLGEEHGGEAEQQEE